MVKFNIYFVIKPKTIVIRVLLVKLHEHLRTDKAIAVDQILRGFRCEDSLTS